MDAWKKCLQRSILPRTNKNTMNCPAAKYKQLPIDPKIHIHYYWPESPFNTEQSIIRGLSVHFERTHLHPKKPFGQTKHAVIFSSCLFLYSGQNIFQNAWVNSQI